MLQWAVSDTRPQPQWNMRLQNGCAPTIATSVTIAGASHRVRSEGLALTPRAYILYADFDLVVAALIFSPRTSLSTFLASSSTLCVSLRRSSFDAKSSA